MYATDADAQVEFETRVAELVAEKVNPFISSNSSVMIHDGWPGEIRVQGDAADYTALAIFFGVEYDSQENDRAAVNDALEALLADCSNLAEQEIRERTQSASPYGDEGAQATVWQGRSGWYWTVISPDSIQYDDDHGPYASRDAAVEAAQPETEENQR